MEMTKEQIESLAKFALEILDDFPELGTLDGMDILDLAEKHKLLIPRTVYARCGEDCNCAEVYSDAEFKDGVTCYHIADWLDPHGPTLRAADQPEQPCPSCHGTGADPMSDNVNWLPCQKCAGKSKRFGRSLSRCVLGMGYFRHFHKQHGTQPKPSKIFRQDLRLKGVANDRNTKK